MNKVYPLIIGTHGEPHISDNLEDLGFIPGTWVTGGNLPLVVSYLRPGERQLVVIDTCIAHGLAGESEAEAAIKGANPQAEILHTAGGSSFDESLDKIKKFLGLA